MSRSKRTTTPTTTGLNSPQLQAISERCSRGAFQCGGPVGTIRRITAGRDRIHFITRTSPPTDTQLGTTRGPEHTDETQASMVRTEAPASARATTREPAPTPVERRRLVHTVRAAWPRHTTRARVHTRQRGRVRTFMEAGARRPYNAETIGPKPIATRTGKPETRRGR